MRSCWPAPACRRLGRPRGRRRRARRAGPGGRPGRARVRGAGWEARPPAELDALSDPEATACVPAERELTGSSRGRLRHPVGAHATPLGDGRIALEAWIGLPDGSEWIHDRIDGRAGGPRAGAGRAAAGRSAPRICCAAGGGADDRVPRRRRPGRSRADDRPRARADRAGRRDRLRPADPGHGARAGARADADLLYAGKEGGGPSVGTGRDRADAARARAGRAARSCA